MLEVAGWMFNKQVSWIGIGTHYLLTSVDAQSRAAQWEFVGAMMFPPFTFTFFYPLMVFNSETPIKFGILLVCTV